MSFILTEGLLSKLLFIFLRVQSGGNSFPPPLSAERERECFRLMRGKRRYVGAK